MMSFKILLLCLLHAVLAKFPVVMVPGDGGSQLFGELNKPSVPNPLCEKNSHGTIPIWFNLKLIAGWWTPCYADNLRLIYDPATHTTHGPPGVKIFIERWGDPEPVEWLDSSHFFDTTYFYQIGQGLVKNHGYVRGKDLRGAPFDFRKGPNELGIFFSNLTKLVEEAYNDNNATRVVVLGHSYGNNMVWLWLTRQTDDWKQKYIESWIDLSGPLAGAVKSVRMYISGDDLNLFPVNPLLLRGQQRSMPSSAYLLPLERYWSKDEIIVTRPGKNYTVYDYKQLFNDLGINVTSLIRQDQAVFQQDLKAPNVKVHAVHGIGVNTEAGYVYSEGQWPDTQPKILYGPGDGTVNTRSLHIPLAWKTQQKQPIIHVPIQGATHLGILEDKTAIDYIGRAATQG